MFDSIWKYPSIYNLRRTPYHPLYISCLLFFLLFFLVFSLLVCLFFFVFRGGFFLVPFEHESSRVCEGACHSPGTVEWPHKCHQASLGPRDFDVYRTKVERWLGWWFSGWRSGGSGDPMVDKKNRSLVPKTYMLGSFYNESCAGAEYEMKFAAMEIFNWKVKSIFSDWTMISWTYRGEQQLEFYIQNASWWCVIKSAWLGSV